MSTIKKRWAILTSNYGRSAINILDSYAKNELTNCELAMVIYDNLPSGAALKAVEIGVQALQVRKTDFATRLAFEDKLHALVKEQNVDFIFLLGFSYILKGKLLKEYNGRILNVHPSLLPSFKGKHAIQQAISHGVKVTGLTTHFIDEELDEGSIILQMPIFIEEHDDFEKLDKKFVETGKELIKNTINLVSQQ